MTCFSKTFLLQVVLLAVSIWHYGLRFSSQTSPNQSTKSWPFYPSFQLWVLWSKLSEAEGRAKACKFSFFNVQICPVFKSFRLLFLWHLASLSLLNSPTRGRAHVAIFSDFLIIFFPFLRPLVKICRLSWNRRALKKLMSWHKKKAFYFRKSKACLMMPF